MAEPSPTTAFGGGCNRGLLDGEKLAAPAVVVLGAGDYG